MHGVWRVRLQLERHAFERWGFHPSAAERSRQHRTLLALLLTCFARCSAQVQVGDLNLNLSGNVSGGYTADYGNLIASDHSVNGAGSADLSGYYYNPNFLSFHLQPFYNQSWANSDFQSVTAASGVTASSSVFSGSRFPGSITFSKTFNSQGNFGVPGVANYTSHGDSTLFSIGWSALIPDLPSLTVSYQQGDNLYSLFGTNQDSASTLHALNATSSYQWDGFNFNGGYHYTTTHLDIPQLFAGQGPETSDSSSQAFSFGIGHPLPLNGSISTSASHADVSLDSTAGRYNASLDTLNAGIGFNPIERLNVGANAQYTNNLTGTLYQSIISSGGAVATNGPQFGSHSLDVVGYATYEVPMVHMTFSGSDDRREQIFEGAHLQSNALTGTVGYATALWNGYLNALGGITHTSTSPSNQTRLGLIGSVGYSRQFGRWKVSEQANYSQNQQTLLISYSTSSYGYSTSLNRKFGRRSNWSATLGGTKTGISNQPGSGSFGQYYSTALSMRWISASAAYSRSTGNAILTPTGLVPTPVPLPIVTPTEVILYGGRSYSFGMGSSPKRGLTLSMNYSRAFSDATTDGLPQSNNQTEQLNVRIQYLLRKINFQAGYIRLAQSFSASGSLPVNTSSFYFGLSRWFNFF